MEIALFASSCEPISMNAKPRDRPVARSCMMLTATTEPACAKWSCKSFSVAVKGRFPTNSLVAIMIEIKNRTQNPTSKKLALIFGVRRQAERDAAFPRGRNDGWAFDIRSQGGI